MESSRFWLGRCANSQVVVPEGTPPPKGRQSLQTSEGSEVIGWDRAYFQPVGAAQHRASLSRIRNVQDDSAGTRHYPSERGENPPLQGQSWICPPPAALRSARAYIDGWLGRSTSTLSAQGSWPLQSVSPVARGGGVRQRSCLAASEGGVVQYAAQRMEQARSLNTPCDLLSGCSSFVNVINCINVMQNSMQ